MCLNVRFRPHAHVGILTKNDYCREKFQNSSSEREEYAYRRVYSAAQILIKSDLIKRALEFFGSTLCSPSSREFDSYKLNSVTLPALQLLRRI